MIPLEKSLRSDLERKVKQARTLAEDGVRASLVQLGVGDANAPAQQSETEKELRRRLRTHGRQLGDVRKADGTQEVERQVEELAYEHWHRMLFARFLAENQLLMYDGVAVTLEECKELSEDNETKSEWRLHPTANAQWELAGKLAAKMLPQIFRPDSPAFELMLPPEHEQKLEALVAALAPEVFKATDSLGWLYQFWQAKRKDDINDSEVKIGARELPAVTQLFTEPYMVSFLLDNALGAWWAGKCLTEKDWTTATSEDELRTKAAIDGVPLEYLRFVLVETNTIQDEPRIDTNRHELKTDPISVHSCSLVVPNSSVSKRWQPAAGTFEAWPQELAELKMLDPSCGSGHFLVSVFLMLVRLRAKREGLSPKDAVDAVLRQNIHGLELDARCVELAVFALALEAWRYPGAGGYRALPELNVACSGLSVSVAKDEWKKLALDKQNMRIALDWMHDTFADAPVLGSLINPAKSNAAKIVKWEELSAHLNQALSKEKKIQEEPRIDTDCATNTECEKPRIDTNRHELITDPISVHSCSLVVPNSSDASTEEQHEAGVVAQGLAKAAMLLGGQYTWVVTNVPYLARGKQNQVLADYCEQNYPEAKSDLATVFLERCLEFCERPKSNTESKKPRIDTNRHELKTDSISVHSCSLVVPNSPVSSGGTVSIVLPQNWLFLGTYKKFREKLLTRDVWHLIARLGPGAFETISGEVVKAILISLSRGQDSDALFGSANEAYQIRGVDVSAPKLAAEKAAGLVNEVVKSVGQAKQLENPDCTIAFENVQGHLLKDIAISSQGITTGDNPKFIKVFWELSKVSSDYLPLRTVESPTHYSGCQSIFFWQNGAGELSNSSAARVQGMNFWAVQGVVIAQMNKLSANIGVNSPWDMNSATIIPNNPSHLPAIWCFCSSPEYNTAVRQIDQSLKVTNSTLVKVPFDLDHWSKVAAVKYPHGLPLPYTNDPTQWIFHGHPCGSVLWNESTKKTSHGPLRKDDTVLQIAVARLLGYRWPTELDPAMELAPEQREWVQRCEALLPFGDDDGVVCIPPVRGEHNAADRLLSLLATAYGDQWNATVLAELLTSVGYSGKTLEAWLRNGFFESHCKLFGNRPFIWHIWDGLADGFSVLVNYHMFDHKLLESLIYTYLGDWITAQKQAGNEERLAAALVLKKSLELILAGEAPYDIFVRWKPLDQQPIGWNPDLNDGVRMNIRPFVTIPDIKVKGAGVLRGKVNVKWDKDRGKDVESAPWYKVFGGDRVNDHHLSLEEKSRARSGK